MSKPSMNTVVSVAEIISSLAIVVSLIYVAYEFKRSETITNRDVENIVYERMLQIDRLLIENPDLARIVLKATDNPEGLTPAEQMQYLAYEHIFYDSWESAWYYYQEGILETESWDGWNTWFIAEAKRRPLLGWMGNRKHFAGGFLEYVDKEVAAARGANDDAQ